MLKPSPYLADLYGAYRAGASARSTQIMPEPSGSLTLLGLSSAASRHRSKSPPLEVNGILYFTVPDKRVWAVECRFVAGDLALPPCLSEAPTLQSRLGMYSRIGLYFTSCPMRTWSVSMPRTSVHWKKSSSLPIRKPATSRGWRRLSYAIYARRCLRGLYLTFEVPRVSGIQILDAPMALVQTTQPIQTTPANHVLKLAHDGTAPSSTWGGMT